MIKAITYITEQKSDQIDYESMGMTPPEITQDDMKEVAFYFHEDEVYSTLEIDKDLYLVEFRDDSQYAIKLTKKQIKDITE